MLIRPGRCKKQLYWRSLSHRKPLYTFYKPPFFRAHSAVTLSMLIPCDCTVTKANGQVYLSLLLPVLSSLSSAVPEGPASQVAACSKPCSVSFVKTSNRTSSLFMRSGSGSSGSYLSLSLISSIPFSSWAITSWHSHSSSKPWCLRAFALAVFFCQGAFFLCL